MGLICWNTKYLVEDGYTTLIELNIFLVFILHQWFLAIQSIVDDDWNGTKCKYAYKMETQFMHWKLLKVKVDNKECNRYIVLIKAFLHVKSENVFINSIPTVDLNLNLHFTLKLEI